MVTAAHCIDIADYRLQEVRLGDTDLATRVDCLEAGAVCVCREEDCPFSSGRACLRAGGCAPPHQTYGVAMAVVHPEFTIRSQVPYSDVGLVKMDGPAAFSRFVQPVCLPPRTGRGEEEAEESRRMVVAGWGVNNVGVRNEVLQLVSVGLQERGVCEERSGKALICTQYLKYS